MENKFYYKDGTTSSKYDSSKEVHRTDGPAVEYADGTKAWYIDGKQHRIDGPAAEYSDGRKCWFTCGRLHRVDGPAVEYTDGDKSWYIDDERYTKKDFNKLIKEVKQLPLALRLIDPREWVRNYGK
jgi:hypothetical protein